MSFFTWMEWISHPLTAPLPWESGGEQEDLLLRFLAELEKPTKDGGRKRERSEKPPWYIDQSHEGAVFSHLTKWKRGELVDPDSGAHPLVHAAWRLLAIACQETGNVPARATDYDESFA